MFSLQRAGLPALLGLLVAALLLTGCGNGTGSNANGNDTYSVGEPIADENIAAVVSSPYGSDTLDVASFQQGAQQGQPPANILESFIAQHVMAGEAEERGLEPDEEAVQQQLQQLRQNFPDEETLNEILAQQGMTMDEVEEEMRSMMRMQTLQEELLASADEISDDEVQAFVDEQADQISAQHILFRVEEGASDEQRAQVRERAEAVLDSARTGEVDFAELAERHGEDGTAQQGGDLGFFSRGRMVEPFADAAFALEEEGDVTEELVETQFGFHIIRLTGRRTDDSVDPEQARAMLQQERQQEIVMDEVERLMRQATVRVNEEVTGTTLPPNN